MFRTHRTTTTVGSTTPGRWRLTAVAVAAAGLTLAGCGTTGGDEEPTAGDDPSADASESTGGEEATCSPTTLAFLGPQTGPYANLGINIVDGAKVKIEEFNAENPDCEITLKTFDSQGDPEKATPLAVQIAGDDSILGVIGPTFSGESEATGPAFAEAGLVTVSASATNPALTQNGWDTFHRILGNDATQAPAVATYMRDTIGSKQAFVVDDASEYGKGLADGVREDLGDLVIDNDTVQQGQTDFSATVTKVKASGADSLFYGGYYAEAGLFFKQLRAGGYQGAFISGDGSKDPGFVESAGGPKAAEGAVLTCPCAPAPAEFATAYKEMSGNEPGTYSAEGYDVAQIFTEAVSSGAADRQAMLDFVNGYDGEGITKQITFDETGEIADVVIYAYEVKGGDTNTGEPIE
ncbi:MAG: Branched-chain amino acid ABC transporter, amino acid-binding protein [uncultured Nocardioidaceae bacterium]|uniref:Branched-chain amino acid ABC transporter, amino acid-binding protein n=1 Tax=uncultured Nocardioidaceae bacterium TaxID=253824 RepID=A0A6J4LER7_9ACTN|nr:MAG: Branched-chain amino acid ABC transporter, amino acid-binding protein [uncultured Nocardioidaceae bacterium]